MTNRGCAILAATLMQSALATVTAEAETLLDPPPAAPQIFVDGFESGGTSAWAVATP